jgi:hypothetical protein
MHQCRQQPPLWLRDAIPVAQKFKQRRGKHRIEILASMPNIMRLESISETFSEAISETRSPAP